MRDDGDFFKSTRDQAQVIFYSEIWIDLFLGSLVQQHSEENCCTRDERDHKENLEVQENLILLKPEHFGTHSEVLIDYGPFIY